MRKATRKKEPMLAAKNKERKVCFLNFIFYILYIYIYIFYGLEMRKEKRKKKIKKERKNLCLQ